MHYPDYFVFVSEKLFKKLSFSQESIFQISNLDAERTVMILMKVSLAAESPVKLNWEQADR